MRQAGQRGTEGGHPPLPPPGSGVRRRISLLDHQPVRRHLAQHFLLSGVTPMRRIALTFDDGPSPRNTPRLLQLLGDKGVPATFFLLGHRVRKFGSLAGEIAAAGHGIGSHTDLHIPLPLLPAWLLRREFRRAQEAIAEATGQQPRWFRPPYGWFDRRVLELAREFGSQPVLGDVYPVDTRAPSAHAIVERVLRRVEPGSIVILHDGGWHSRVDRSRTIDAVDELTDLLGEQGWEFTGLEGLEQGHGPSGA